MLFRVLLSFRLRNGAPGNPGPFYCPEDEKVYLDLAFFDELRTKFGAPGQFAQAYVIAHEFGHHVQKLLGIEQKVRRLQQENAREVKSAALFARSWADCFAGVWAHTTEQRHLVNARDIESAMRAAAARSGDDRLQRMGQGFVNPETFTHTEHPRSVWNGSGEDSIPDASAPVQRLSSSTVR